MNEQLWDGEIKNELESSPFTLPAFVRDKMDDVYSRLPDYPIRSSIRIRIVWVSVCALLLFVGIFASGFVSPAVAKVLRQLPVIGSAFQTVGDEGIQRASEKGLVSTVGQTVEDKGVAVTLDQVIYDGTRLSIGILHSSDIQISLPGAAGMIRIDGKELNAGMGGVSKEIANGMTASVYKFTTEEQLPDRFMLDFHFHEVTRNKEGRSEKIAGSWWLSTPVVKLAEDVNVIPFDPPLIREHAGIRIAVTEVTSTPLTTKVAFELEVPDKYDYMTFNRGEVPKGELVTTHRLDYELVDSNGLSLEPLSGSGSQKPGEPEKRVVLFAPVTSDVKSLTLRTIESADKMRSQGDGSFVGVSTPEIHYAPLPIDAPFTMKQGNAGEIEFRSIRFEKDQTWIEYEVRGTEPYIQDNAWWLENGKGDRYLFDRYDQTRISEVSYAYRVKLPAIQPDESLKIAVVQIDSKERIEQLDIQLPIVIQTQ
ncbi:DUF4179 domain-containing protein [Cohnella cholangitidis]|uniref:DUF4179 domain-containing protein n=1 Tax=Cohnella cholangitidis TaxID=2598458 RepID=A0A7G5BTD5_9BACL|nr:DUF4179 domain-containing protein [Cohnella cholangitidis]QMV40219.1 DUF4179 domain-containing protein [Cohnella cholangitidis]